jgi:hypothetical protein
MRIKKSFISWVLPALLIGAGPTVFAQEYEYGRTVGDSDEVGSGLKGKAVAIAPHLGIVEYNDITGGSTTRGVAGLSIDWNAVDLLGWNNWSLGPATGIFFSHLGDPGSNFFGTGSGVEIGQSSANLMIIPANLKMGYNFSDRLRVGLHGGGNVVYRTNELAMQLGTNGVGSEWDVFPNAGADVEFGLGKSVALSLRPDWTFAGEDIFTGTVNLGFIFG